MQSTCTTCHKEITSNIISSRHVTHLGVPVCKAVHNVHAINCVEEVHCCLAVGQEGPAKGQQQQQWQQRQQQQQMLRVCATSSVEEVHCCLAVGQECPAKGQRQQQQQQPTDSATSADGMLVSHCPATGTITLLLRCVCARV
jgi:hypothetical protein